MNKKKESKVVPNVRFKGFTDDWKQRKLGELALFNPKDELPQTFEYVDLESVVGTEMLLHRAEVKSSAPSRAQRLAHTGDLFYQTVRPYQKNNYLFEKTDNNYVFSTGYAQMRPYVDGYFLLSLVQSERFVKVVLDNCTGTSYPAINANDLAEIEVAAPSDESEAQKIGTIFRSIDRLITLHQRKIDKLKNLKKAMLEKMFPKKGSVIPEIRFNGFVNAWEQRKLGEITDVRDGTHDSPKYVQEGHPFITSKNVSNGFINYDDVQYVTDADYEEINKRSKVDVHDILMGMIGTIGNLALIRKEPDFAIKNVALIKYTGDVDYQYLYQALQAGCVTNQLSTGMDGGTQKFVSLKKIRELDIPFPDGWEQRKIGAYFSTLDHLITLNQRKIDMLKKLKSACLSEMFI